MIKLSGKVKQGLAAAFISIIMLYVVSCTWHPREKHEVKILTQPCIKPYTDYTYTLGNNFTFSIDGDEITIPKGFQTDLASIPRIWWVFLAPQYSAFMAPSIIHDFFYRCTNIQNRYFADVIFYNALKSQGVSNHTASQFYSAVRLFGAHSYTKDKDCYAVRD